MPDEQSSQQKNDIYTNSTTIIDESKDNSLNPVVLLSSSYIHPLAERIQFLFIYISFKSVLGIHFRIHGPTLSSFSLSERPSA
jgi:hypothetical protein